MYAFFQIRHMISRKRSARSQNMFAYTRILLIVRHCLSFSGIRKKQSILTQKSGFYKDFRAEFTNCSADELCLTEARKGGKLTKNQTDGSGTVC